MTMTVADMIVGVTTVTIIRHKSIAMHEFDVAEPG
ncbi:hypothetical protein HK44_008650 [Pseudomonas fluorescens HK44]|uniref:Uncharacterized protein n=1 Tax=Pseudomonas fluorescens HK44 TaxID=1042209 RepID=A0A010RNS2_PSEFL|nr:hypothetical protein HK44_008650 [Pseudomonas fluorescens HK44]